MATHTAFSTFVSRTTELLSGSPRLEARLKAEDLTPQELNSFVTVERVCSTLSLLGCLFIAVTFLGSRAFHKPINRLVFFASMGNVFTNVATIMSRAAVHNAAGGLCQFQAFLIQMFMPADAYWTLAMAVNVYLTFYWKFDAESLRALEKYYIMICYGAPFVPAFVYLWIKTPEKGHLYGNATLWCWVSSDWDVIRIYTFYGPVWVVILLTIAIYMRTGREIYTKRKQLRNFALPPPDPLPIIGDPFQSVKTTEVFVTSESVDATSSDSIDLGSQSQQGLQKPHPAAPPSSKYTVTVSSSQPSHQNQNQYSYTEKPVPGHSVSMQMVPVSSKMPNSERSNLYPARRYAAMEANNAAWGYTKVAVLFFIAMMVTWIPSSANRVYSVCHPGEVSLGLEFASAFVLPLQGFWNALIYATTSLPACKQLWSQISQRKRMSSGGLKQISEVFAGNEGPRHSSRKQAFDTESTTELASRPATMASSR